MSARDELRKGWCPGALRPMQTGDGLLVRVKPRAGTFSIHALRVIADVARRYGNGEIDLTNRANLQMRGMNDATLTDVLIALGDAGLLDATPEAESVRNVVVDPVSGLHSRDHDVRPLALEIEGQLAATPACYSLPAKFGISCAGPDAAFDWFAGSDINVALDCNGMTRISLEGDPNVVSEMPLAETTSTVLRLAILFADLNAAVPQLRRMRDAVLRDGAAAILRNAGLAVTPAIQQDRQARPLHPGMFAGTETPLAAVIGLPFGRITAPQLAALCSAAGAAKISEIKLSPRRLLLLTCRELPDVRAILECAKENGLITHSNDPRLSMDVCPGAPACENASTSTRTDAAKVSAWLAKLEQPWPSIHISGCQKGCARRDAAALTFVANSRTYAAILNGSADGQPLRINIDPKNLAQAAAELLKVQP